MLFFCQKLLHTQGRVDRGIVVVKEPIIAATTFLVVFSVHYRVIFSTPLNKIADSQFFQEELIPCAKFRWHQK